MIVGDYTVQVSVRGDSIPFYQYNNLGHARLRVRNNHTPQLREVFPRSGVPGSFINITGYFHTICYLRDRPGCADDRARRISRVYIGAQQCDLVNQTSNEL